MLIAVSNAKMAAGGVSIRLYIDKSSKISNNIYQVSPFGRLRVVRRITTAAERDAAGIEANKSSRVQR